MSRPDWKCSLVHGYWLTRSKWSFSTLTTDGVRYVYPRVGEWVTQLAFCYHKHKSSCYISDNIYTCITTLLFQYHLFQITFVIVVFHLITVNCNIPYVVLTVSNGNQMLSYLFVKYTKYLPLGANVCLCFAVTINALIVMTIGINT